MEHQTERCAGPGVLLLTFSPQARAWLVELLRQTGLEAIDVDGRAPDAAECLRAHHAAVVVVDASAGDVSLTQTLREVGRVRQGCLVLAVRQGRETVAVYRDGRLLGTVESLEAALRDQVGLLKT